MKSNYQIDFMYSDTSGKSSRVMRESEHILEQHEGVLPFRRYTMRHTGIFDADALTGEPITKYRGLDENGVGGSRSITVEQYKKLGRPEEITLDTYNTPFRVKAHKPYERLTLFNFIRLFW